MGDSSVQSAKVIPIIRTTEVHGDGSKSNPVRTVRSYWALNGEPLFQEDPYLGGIDSASSNVNSEST